MKKKDRIKIAVVSILMACGQYALSEETLRIECVIRLEEPVGGKIFRSALTELKRNRHIDTRRSPEDGKLRWFKVDAAPLQTARTKAE